MISLFRNYLRRTRRFQRYDDAYAAQQSTKLRVLERAIRRQLVQPEAQLIVVHFPDAFETVQDHLERNGLDYQVGGLHCDFLEIQRHFHSFGSQPLLVLSETLRSQHRETWQADERAHRNFGVAAMVIERHPWPYRDGLVEQFLVQLPARSRLGYLLALDDPCLRVAIDESLVHLMEILGMERDEMVSSEFLTRRVRRKLLQLFGNLKSERTAHSAEDWLLKNRPHGIELPNDKNRFSRS